MNPNQIYHGHNLAVLLTWPDQCIDMCLTSPPYFGLRNYHTQPQIWGGDYNCAHEWKFMRTEGLGNPRSKKSTVVEYNERQDQDQFQSNICAKCGAWQGELGQESQPNLYISHLCDLFDEVKRVLKDHGTCWVNIADSYSGSGGKDGSGLNDDVPFYKQNGSDVANKSLIGIPERFVLEMTKRGWIRRNTIIWHKPNCLPSSIEDRFTVDFEYLYFFSKNPQYYFKQQFELNKNSDIINKFRSGTSLKRKDFLDNEMGSKIEKTSALRAGNNQYPHNNYRNRRCVWTIPTEPTPDAHFATYPTKLCEIPIDAGCPPYLCKSCGKPREYIVEKNLEVKCPPIGGNKAEGYGNRIISGNDTYKMMSGSHWSIPCACNQGWEAGIVLDPFFGSGTTGLVALKQGKRFVGIELNPEYITIAKKKLGGLLHTKTLTEMI